MHHWQVLDFFLLKAVFQFRVSYVILYTGDLAVVFYKPINLKKDTQITLSTFVE